MLLRRILIIAAFSLALAPNGIAQDLRSKLGQKADFVPEARLAKDALIEIAAHYKIAMGIEWAYDTRPSRAILLTPQPTVEDMINLVLSQAPGYSKNISKGVVSIRKENFAGDRRNFLTFRLADYRVRNANVFGAEWQLRVNIHRALHPENYACGLNGGYGQPDRCDGFNIRDISFERENITVREILDAIVTNNRNSFWIVELNRSKMMREEPFFVQRTYGTDVQTDFAWRIIPFTVNAANR